MASDKEIMDTINAPKRRAIDPAAATLERAVSPDPVFEWVFPDPPTRTAAVRTLNRVPLEYGLRYGRVMASLLPFYERHGVVILEEATPGKGGPLAWAMRCEPKREAAAREGGAERCARAR